MKKRKLNIILFVIILFLILGFILNFTFGGIIILSLFGLISGIIVSIKKKKLSKYVLIGGWVGFIIPWVILTYISKTCTEPNCGHLGYLAYGFIFYSIILFLIGCGIGYLSYKFKK